MSFRTIVIFRTESSTTRQSEAKDLECINASYYCHSERSEESECINMYTPSSGIQILRRDAPLDDKWRRIEQS